MQAFFDSSTPVPNGQETPVSVKAADVLDPTSYNLPNNCPNCGVELDPYWDFDAWHCSSCLDIVQAVQLLEAEAVHFAGQYPVMDYPALPDNGIKEQLDRMQGLINEMKGIYAPEPLTNEELELIRMLIGHEFGTEETNRLFGKIVALNQVSL